MPSPEQAQTREPVDSDKPIEATTAAAATPEDEDDRPVRVLVQTRTHLVPGDKSTQFGERISAMEHLICQHVWQRDFDRRRERGWDYGCTFALHDVECWFLVDHHGPDPLPPDPPVVWFTWTGTEIVMVRDPLPGRVRRELRRYPFERIPNSDDRPTPGPRPPRQFASRAEEIQFYRGMLCRVLLRNVTLTERLVRFAMDNPGAAEWVKARVPPEAWARVEDPTEMVLWYDVEMGTNALVAIGSLDMPKHPES